MRENIFNIIEPHTETTASKVYDNLMIVVIGISLVPLLFRRQFFVFDIFEIVSVTIFIIDYILRLVTADYKLKKHSISSFVKYPFTPMAIIDLLTILPSITPLHNGFKALRLLRLFRALRVIRILRYSKSIQIINEVFKKQKKSLFAVLGFAIGYVLITALIMFQVEPQTFKSFYDACYWATVSLTTVGYGDIYAVTAIGRFFTMLSAFVGIAIVALPAGIITAGYLEELRAIQPGESEMKRDYYLNMDAFAILLEDRLRERLDDVIIIEKTIERDGERGRALAITLKGEEKNPPALFPLKSHYRMYVNGNTIDDIADAIESAIHGIIE